MEKGSRQGRLPPSFEYSSWTSSAGSQMSTGIDAHTCCGYYVEKVYELVSDELVSFDRGIVNSTTIIACVAAVSQKFRVSPKSKPEKQALNTLAPFASVIRSVFSSWRAHATDSVKARAVPIAALKAKDGVHKAAEARYKAQRDSSRTVSESVWDHGNATGRLRRKKAEAASPNPQASAPLAQTCVE